MLELGLVGLLVSATDLIYGVWKSKKDEKKFSILEKDIKKAIALGQAQDIGNLIGYLQNTSWNVEPEVATPLKAKALDLLLDKAVKVGKKSESVNSLLARFSNGTVHIKEADQQILNQLCSSKQSSNTQPIISTLPEIPSDSMFMTAMEFMKRRKLSFAQQILNDIINDGNTDWRVINALAICQLRLSNPKAALKTYSRLDPKYWEAHAHLSFNRAVVFYELHDFVKAQSGFLDAIGERS
ncbi:MAG: hypothetical protein HQL69_09470, partial [Magnetococcales bacterium]|nr:hypothetical protein [Magnetococcales bacterium]